MKNIVDIKKQGRFWVVIINGLECEWYQMKAAAVEAAKKWRKIWPAHIATVITRTIPAPIATAKNILTAIVVMNICRTATAIGTMDHSFAQIASLSTWKTKTKLPVIFRRHQ